MSVYNTSNFNDKPIALLIGINYLYTNYRLRGCQNDVFKISNLVSHFDQIIMTDDSIGEFYPSRANIIIQIQKLISYSWINRKRFFIYFSGHGSEVDTMKEKDGKDECIVCADLEKIMDDELNRLLKRFSPMSNILVITDCCCSGTILDLPIVYTDTKNFYMENFNSIFPFVIHIGGCCDSGTSLDIICDDKKYGGAMTQQLCKYISYSGLPIINIFGLVKFALEKTLQIPSLTSSRIIKDETLNSFVGI